MAKASGQVPDAVDRTRSPSWPTLTACSPLWSCREAADPAAAAVDSRRRACHSGGAQARIGYRSGATDRTGLTGFFSNRLPARADRRTISAARIAFEAWVQAVHGEFAAFLDGDRQRAITASLGPDRELRKSYEQSLADAQALGDGSVRSASSSVAAAASRSILILVACLLVALAIGVGVAYWLVRSVAFPLFRLVALLTQDLPV